MGAREDERRRRALTREVRSTVARDLRRMRRDAGLTQARVARAADLSPAHLSAIERGRAEASTGALVAIADVLGADLAVRAYPTTGPRIHDHIQAAIVEALLRVVRPRWQPFVEVPVGRPARGYIDLVLREADPPSCICTEVQSSLGRLEQALRWAEDKADSLPSADLWKGVAPTTRVSRLLVLRSTRATRDLARRYPELLATAYPARARDVFDAVTDDVAWPGAGILWVRYEGGRVTLLSQPPRGVALRR